MAQEILDRRNLSAARRRVALRLAGRVAAATDEDLRILFERRDKWYAGLLYGGGRWNRFTLPDLEISMIEPAVMGAAVAVAEAMSSEAIDRFSGWSVTRILRWRPWRRPEGTAAADGVAGPAHVPDVVSLAELNRLTAAAKRGAEQGGASEAEAERTAALTLAEYVKALTREAEGPPPEESARGGEAELA
ncbi:hypothetical protein [Streptomyces sp. NRRL F-2747]|uniref:hypothetical protein n=1 Tax=Streptomyces sp. NRRL F-2747 TaxID=1463843 RepID=UPI00131B1245|nr:hypothetical protein [Streptomyces sp. NRRL F-2747]